jgi:apolipoprotein N-acyltransferase
MNAQKMNWWRNGWILIPVLALLVMGCKKEDVTVAPIVEIPASGTGGAASAEVTAMNEALVQQNYDQAVAKILAAQRKDLNAMEQEAVAAATSQLLDASARDPQALEAYKNLSRLRHGR